MLLDVRPDHLKIVQDILQRFVPDREVWAFGSRAKWLAKEYSDLDLCVLGETPLSFRTLGLLEEAFDESDLPYKVDVVDWATTSASFRKIIERDKVVIQELERDKFTEELVPLISLVSIRGGKRLPAGKSLQQIPNSHPYIRVRDLGKRGLPEMGLEYVPDELFPPISRYIVETNDVLLSIVGTIGALSIVGQRYHLASLTENCVKLTGLDRTDALYLYYYLSSPFGQHEISKGTVGAVQPKLPIYNIEKLPVPWGDKSWRSFVSETLGSLDDKIAQLRETNTTLEAIAQAVFKSWFVDFDPVRAKAEGREPEGITPETSALFPSEFQDSELGEIPQGWTIRRLGDALELAYGKALKATDRSPGTVPVYGSGGITGYHNQHLVAGPSVIVGRKGTVGSLYWEDRPFFPIDTVFYVKPKAPPLTFCYYLLRTLGLDSMNTDAAVPGLNRDNAYRLTYVMPTDEVFRAFDNCVISLREKIFASSEEVRNLSEIRDALLPRLMSGKLRIPEIQEAAGETTA